MTTVEEPPPLPPHILHPCLLIPTLLSAHLSYMYSFTISINLTTKLHLIGFSAPLAHFSQILQSSFSLHDQTSMFSPSSSVPLLYHHFSQSILNSLSSFFCFSVCLDDLRVCGRSLPLPPALHTTAWGQVTAFRGFKAECHLPNPCLNMTCSPPLTCTPVWGHPSCRSVNCFTCNYEYITIRLD